MPNGTSVFFNPVPMGFGWIAGVSLPTKMREIQGQFFHQFLAVHLSQNGRCGYADKFPPDMATGRKEEF
jgi:hypothetical protein